VRPSTISICGSLPVTTTTSADFLAHRNRIYSETSPSKSMFLRSIAAGSTWQILRFLRWDVSMMYYLIRFALPHIRFLFSLPWARSKGQYRILQSRFLQCIPHGKPPFGWAHAEALRLANTYRTLPLRIRNLHPLEISWPIPLLLKNLFVFLIFFSSFRVGALHAHAGHTHMLNIIERIWWFWD